MPHLLGPGPPNVLCFIGSWFFTVAAWLQVALSDPSRWAERYTATTQFAGTILFNVSTGAAVWAHAVKAERRLVWAPDVFGSLAFLISGALGMLAVTAATGLLIRSRDWQGALINLVGCVAFAVSAVGAFVSADGVSADALLANQGTFIGALCFLAAALLALPRAR